MMNVMLLIFVMLMIIGGVSEIIFMIGVFILLINVLNYFMMEESYSYVNLFGSIDLLSWVLIMLSMWIFLLMRFSMKKYNVSGSYMYNILEISMLIVLFFSFFCNSMVGFYLFFESVLIPMILIIFIWGGNFERVQAGLWMLMYTLFGSLPLFIIIVRLYNHVSLNYMMFNWEWIDFSSLIGFLFIMAFLVKLPMYGFHMWLPKAHVEAPVGGSMILAGVLLKLGGYGLFRFEKFIYLWMESLGIFIMIFSLLGGLIIGFECLRQVDVKMLIAYSSVVHMSLVLGGLLSMNMWGESGMMVLMVGHGICSSGLFFLVNLFYERLGSRNMMISKGLGSFMGMIMVMWFLLCIINLGVPFSMNFLGEFIVILGLVKFSFFSFFVLMIMSFLGACFSLYLFVQMYHGKSWLIMSIYDYNQREFILGGMHLFPLFFFILKSDILLMFF